MSKYLPRIILSGVLAAASLMVVTDINAQTRKKRRTARKPAPVRTQPAYTADPIIVSRASDFAGESSTTAEPALVPVITDGTAPAPLDERDRALAEIADRIKTLERSMKKGYDEKQKTLLLNLDILTRAEQRTESLRKQRFELIEKESAIQLKLDQIENDIRPEMIERSVAMVGSLRPEELRNARRKNLEAERRNLQALLTDVQATRQSLEGNVRKSEELVEKIRATLEKDIDAALVDDKPE